MYNQNLYYPKYYPNFVNPYNNYAYYNPPDYTALYQPYTNNLTKYNYIEVAVDAYTTLGNVTLTYYRKPLRFNTTTGASKCELPESVHSEIVDLAVNMFITEGKYRLQTKPSNQSNRE